MIHDVLQLEKLAETLHRANSGVPEWCRSSFYGAKDFLLAAFGTADGRDVQRIDDACFRCDGTGEFGRHRYYGGECCLKCNGSGIYRRRLVWLDRFRFGAYTFHRPVGGVQFYENATVTIVGRIKHERFDDSARAAADLAWLFNRAAFRAEVLEAIEATQFEPSRPTWIETQAETIGGPGALAAAMWCRDKRLEDAREWKRLCEAKVEGVPF